VTESAKTQKEAQKKAAIEAAEREAEIDSIFCAVFKGASGEKALNYLKNMTLNRVLPASATDSELRQREGQREIVAHIIRRVENGRNRQ